MSIIIKNVMLISKKKRDIYIEDNMIKKIGGNIKKKTDLKIDGKKFIAIPAFANMHSHSAMSLLRGYVDDLMLDEWLNKYIWPIESKMSEKEYYFGTRLGFLEMIKNGICLVNDMYFRSDITKRVAKEFGIRVCTGPVFFDFFNEDKREQNIKKIQEELKKIENVKYDKCFLSINPHAPYSVSKEGLLECKRIAKEKDAFLHIHVSETKREVEDFLKENKERPFIYLNNIGFLDGKVIAAHSIWIDEKEARVIAKEKCTLVHCPNSNMKLVSGVFNYPLVRKYKINVCLGTDSNASNNCLNILSEMKNASLLQKVFWKDPKLLKVEEAFKMSTENVGKFFGIKFGEIKEGYLADIALIKKEDISMTPNTNILSNIVYSLNSYAIDTLICDGNIIMQNRKVKNENKIIKEAERTAEKLIKKADYMS